ncbi:IS3 family transposase [Parasutterella sp. NM82_D38]|uniref:IS3 family transposase n=2 Tax=Parasutterella muris TaxID=2565572 RepID=A0A6L6YIE8_9BURK|nr:IS3 family transposase [Parasutterella muris]
MAISRAFASSIATQVIEGKFRSSLKAAEFYGLEPRSVQRKVKSELKNHKGRTIVGDSSRSGDENMRYSITSVLAYTFTIKEWITKNFNLKDHSESNIVSIVESLKGKGVPIKEACSWLGIHRSTLYRKRQKQLRAEEDDPLVTQISELQKRRNFAYGAKRMAVYLSKLNGFAINHKRVARLMRLPGLNSRVRPKRRIHYKTELLEPVQEPLYNVLKRDFSSSGPMTKLVTGMTFAPVREGWVVLSTIKDLFNHKIVAWETGSSAKLQLALATLNKLPTKEGLLPSD